MSAKPNSKQAPAAGAEKAQKPAEAIGPTKPEGLHVIVSAVAKEGRRRAGIDFAHAGTPLALDDLTEAQWEAILADPQLTVRPAKNPEPEED
ncbi:HI1506-related protein [Chelatococcus sp. XZ-Ab1]|uniref:HI1506-related protein n=1 Tax=Chelatococcus sp. XZ-Ab1 TaxID=3034027 RepID=UPI0023E38A61|nr:HI1506-related protein [Chelatococcus sp. XZ-Ab1]